MPATVCISAVVPGDGASVAAVRSLLEEYLAWLGPLVCGSTLPAEIASLPVPYDPPDGALLLVRDVEARPVGCVGIRRSSGTACEIKRLYVRRDARRRGVARALVRAAIDQARVMGYAEMRLTTLPDEMPGVVELYRSFGFEAAEPFEHHGGQSADGVTLVCMSRRL